MNRKKMSAEELRSWKNDVNVQGLVMLHPPQGKTVEVTYKEPPSYFNEEMRKAAQEWEQKKKEEEEQKKKEEEEQKNKEKEEQKTETGTGG